jgi:acyl-CoA-dependent ceramide synthase
VARYHDWPLDACALYASLGVTALIPASAFVLMMIPVILWANQWMLIDLGLMGPYKVNPFAWMIFPSHRLPNGLYHKGLLDFVFIGYYIIFWSFVRQFVTLYILRPMGRSLGIKGSKVMRFTEQGYAVFYFGIMGTAGIVSWNDGGLAHASSS